MYRVFDNIITENFEFFRILVILFSYRYELRNSIKLIREILLLKVLKIVLDG